MKLLKCQNILFAALGTFFLIACGESTTSETTISEYQGNLDVIADIAELPKCTSENEGEQIFVKSISAVRVCAGGDWYAVAGTASQVTSCSTEELADGTGIKILCGGDSIGVVLNGVQGEKGEAGAQGLQGEKGDKGDIGATGAQGLQGEKGDKGDIGATGAQGLQGEKGETGATGAAGTPGKDGATGAAGTPGKDGASCTVVTLPDNAGLKVLCGGDSVGVVLNGEKGDKGDKGDKGEQGDVGPAGSGAGSEGSSCNLVNKDCIVHVACGKDTVSLEIYSDDESCKEVVVLDTEAIALNLEGIGGTSQKGPFLTGSEVVAYELLDGRTLQQTGKTFSGKILSDKGDFDIKTVSLASQYATLTAKGYYLNEVTGKPSNSQITLTALTNLRGRAVANINLLTHLENERAQYLVVVDKMTVAAAKKKAEAEVFSLFHIDSKDFAGYSEDLSVAGTSDADAALLAMSILLQGNRSEAELSALLTTISKSMEETGKWNDEATKVAIADWAAGADSAGLLTKFRENVAGWGLSQKVANFEPYFRNYWHQEFGLGNCDVGSVVPAKKGYKANSLDRYICVDSVDVLEGKAWRLASNYEKDTFGWNDTIDGAIKFGNVNTQDVYLRDGDTWVPADAVQAVLGGCVESREGEVADVNKLYNICRSRKWEVATAREYDTYGWKDSTDGALKEGRVNQEETYVFDALGSDGVKGWRTALNIELLYGLCRKTMYDSIRAESAGGTHYICREQDHKWSLVTNKVYIDTRFWKAEEDGFAKRGTYFASQCYVFDTSSTVRGYRLGNEQDCSLGLAGCTKGIQELGEIKTAGDGNKYLCNSNKWSLANVDAAADNMYGIACDKESVGAVKKGKLSERYFVCDLNGWRVATNAEYSDCVFNHNCLLNICRPDQYEEFRDLYGDGVDYVCENQKWRIPTKIELDARMLCNESRLGVRKEHLDYKSGNGYDAICDMSGKSYVWRLASVMEYSVDQWKKLLELYPVTTEYADKPLVDNRDPRHVETYRTVNVDGHVWMAENLRYADSVNTPNLKKQVKCVGPCEAAGMVYTWNGAMDIPEFYDEELIGKLQLDASNHQGICPDGWHVPSVDDWNAMYDAMGKNPGDMQKTGLGLENATDKYGFSAYPLYFGRGDWWLRIEYAVSWAANGSGGYNEPLSINGGFLYGEPGGPGGHVGVSKENFVALRCVKDPDEDYAAMTCTEDGSLVSGAVIKGRKYVCDGGAFRMATEQEKMFNKGCTSYNVGESVVSGSESYVCRNSVWTMDSEADFRDLTCTEDASILNGLIDPRNRYVCDNGTIRKASYTEQILKKGCTSYNDEEVVLYSGTYYICKNSEWVNDPSLDYKGLSCPEDNSVVSGILNPDNKYVCENGKFRAATASEVKYNRACIEGSMIFEAEEHGLSTVDFICKNKTWQPADIYDYSLEQWDAHMAKWDSHASYGTMTDSRDGRVYKTLDIGGKTWMAENLKYADYRKSPNLVGNNRCYYNDEKNCEIAGRLYTWTAAMDLSPASKDVYAYENGVDSTNHQGICPDGWRLPTAGDWAGVIAAVGDVNDMLVQGLYVYEKSTNSSGMNIVPSNYYYGTDFSSGMMSTAFFWTTTEYVGVTTQVSYMTVIFPGGFSISQMPRTNGLSVRCVKD